MLECDEACWAAEECYGCFRSAERMKGASEVVGEGFCVPKDIGLVEEEGREGLRLARLFKLERNGLKVR